MTTTGWIRLGNITSEYSGLFRVKGYCEARCEYDSITRNNANSVTMTNVKIWHRYMETYSDQASGLKYTSGGFRIGLQVPNGQNEKWGFIGADWEYAGSSGKQLSNGVQWYVVIPSVTFWVDAGATGINVRLWRNATDSRHLWDTGGYVQGLVWVPIPPVPHTNATATGSSSSETDESNPWVSYSNPSGTDMEVKLELPNLGDYSLVGSLKNIGSATSGTYTWSLEEETRERIRQLMANHKKTTLRHTLRDLHSNHYTFRDSEITIVNSNPIFSDFSYKDNNPSTIAITENDQIIIKGKSALKMIISPNNKATPKKHATIKNYRFVCDGDESSANYSMSEVSSILSTTNISNTSISVEAIDSRGDKTSVYKQISQIVPYEAPKITVSAARQNGFSNTTTISLTAYCSLLKINGVVKNQVSKVEWRRRQSDSSSWSSWESRSFTMDDEAGKLSIADFSKDFDNSVSWVIEARIIDKLETATATFNLSAGSPLLFLETDGRTSIGGMPEKTKPSSKKGQLEVFGDIFANGNRVAELPISFNDIKQALWDGGQWIKAAETILASNLRPVANSQLEAIIPSQYQWDGDVRQVEYAVEIAAEITKDNADFRWLKLQAKNQDGWGLNYSTAYVRRGAGGDSTVSYANSSHDFFAMEFSPRYSYDSVVSKIFVSRPNRYNNWCATATVGGKSDNVGLAYVGGGRMASSLPITGFRLFSSLSDLIILKGGRITVFARKIN